MQSWLATCAPWSGSGSRPAKSPEQVRSWLIQRYGNWVSYRPPVEPVTWPLWAAPVLLLARRRLAASQAAGQEARMTGYIVLLASGSGHD